MDTDNLSINKEIDVVKLYWASLFSRKQPYAIVGHQPNTMIFTTITPLQILTYRPIIEDYIHIVTFKDPLVFKIVTKRLMMDKIICYNIRDLASVLGKQKDLFALKLLPNGEIWPISEPLPKALVAFEEIPTEEDDPEDAGETTTEETEEEDDDVEDDETKAKKLARQYYGWHLTDLQFQSYLAIIDRCLKDREFKAHDISSTTTTHDRSTVYSIILDIYGGVKIPTRQGYNIPAILEYSARSKLSHLLQAQVARNRDVLNIVFEFDDSTVNVKSMQPGVAWFPSSKEEHPHV